MFFGQPCLKADFSEIVDSVPIRGLSGFATISEMYKLLLLLELYTPQSTDAALDETSERGNLNPRVADIVSEIGTNLYSLFVPGKLDHGSEGIKRISLWNLIERRIFGSIRSEDLVRVSRLAYPATQ